MLTSISHRRLSIVGTVAITAGFATYLGAYSYQFRRLMLQEVWPNRLKECGLIVEISVADSLTVDISMSTLSVDTNKLVQDLHEAVTVIKASKKGIKKLAAVAEPTGSDSSLSTDDGDGPQDVQDGKDQPQGAKSEVAEISSVITQSQDTQVDQTEDVQVEASASDAKLAVQGEQSSLSTSSSLLRRTSSEKTKKLLTAAKSFVNALSDGSSIYAYDAYCLAVLRLLIGDSLQRNLITKGVNYREIEDLSVIAASVQTPLLIIDPYDRAMKLLDSLWDNMVKVNMAHK